MPPAMGPSSGSMCTGSIGGRYAKVAAARPSVSSALLVSIKACSPLGRGGVTQTTSNCDTQMARTAAYPPKLQVLPCSKPRPVSETFVPPRVGPTLGAMANTVAVAW